MGVFCIRLPWSSDWTAGQQRLFGVRQKGVYTAPFKIPGRRRSRRAVLLSTIEGSTGGVIDEVVTTTLPLHPYIYTCVFRSTSAASLNQLGTENYLGVKVTTGSVARSGPTEHSLPARCHFR